MGLCPKNIVFIVFSNFFFEERHFEVSQKNPVFREYPLQLQWSQENLHMWD